MSIGRRTRGVFAGVIFGLLLVPGSIILHAWNEYRTIHRTRGLKEALRDVVSVDADRIATEQNGKLVHVAGLAHTDDVLVDDEFGIRENAVHLKRTVEMYQWVESKHERDGKKTYDYDLKWKEGRERSESFHRKNGYTNPPLKFSETESSASDVTVGSYHLNTTLRDQMDFWRPIELNEAAIREVRKSDANQFVVSENQLFWSAESPNPDSPELGDHRISFKHVLPGDVSLMAKLKGESFATYNTSNGEPIERLYEGLMDAGQVIGNLKTENTLLAWGIRVGGTFLCVLGVSMLFGPAKSLFSWIPLVGEVTGFLFFVVALLIGMTISLLTISISWIAVRPLLGITLLAIAGVGIYFLVRVRKSVQNESPTLQDDPPMVSSDMFVN